MEKQNFKNIKIDTDPNRRIKSLSDSLVELSDKLSEKLSLTKTVLVLSQVDSDQLSAVSTWENGTIKDGLTITLPKEQSILKEISNGQRFKFIENIEKFEGNFFEKKLLLNSQTKSVMIQPLIINEEVVGLLSFGSDSDEFPDQKTIDQINKLSTNLASRIFDKNRAEKNNFLVTT